MTDIRPFNPALFGDAAIDPDTANLNAQMIELLTDQPEWWIVGAQEARAARRRGEGPFPAPVFSDRARTITISSHRCSGCIGEADRQSRYSCVPPYKHAESETIANGRQAAAPWPMRQGSPRVVPLVECP